MSFKSNNRIRYYEAEKERLCKCAEYLREIFASPSTNADDLDTIQTVLREMVARVDTWQRIIDGCYDISKLRKTQLSSLYGKCCRDE